MNEYVPGRSNITEEDAKKRVAYGKKALIAAVLYVVAAFLLSLPQVFMLAVAIPLFVGTRALLEGRSRFSTSYGLSGLYDEGQGAKHTKEDVEAQHSDRIKAQSMLLFSTSVSVVGALFCYVALV